MVRCALLIGVLAGCSSVLGIEELNGPGGDDAAPPPTDLGPNLTPCGAQRLVHIVGGDGGLAWFTQVWPVPANVTSFSATIALDSPNNFSQVTAANGHPLFVRNVGTSALWTGRGTAPQPTIFIAGQNETHTTQPSSAVTSTANGLVPAAAALQGSLAPRVAVLVLVNSGPYGTAPNAPQAMLAADVEPTITALQQGGTISATEATQLRPTANQLAKYFDANVPASVSALGTRLAFIANAFKLGVFGSVVLPAFQDDPHAAFMDVTSVTARANQLAKLLDAFYLELSSANELGCGNDSGDFLSLADNTMMMVTGDTYKNPFMSSGWPDGTPLNTNLMFLRSNGYIKPGWFGTLTSATTSFFDPATGATGGTQAADTQAAWASALYGVTRGNKMAIASYTAAEFSGTTAQ